MIDRLSNRTALAIGVVGLLAVVLVGWFAVVSPQRSKASELEGKIAEGRTALAARRVPQPGRRAPLDHGRGAGAREGDAG